MNSAQTTANPEPVQVIAVAGAGNGSGRTSVAVNLAAALANRGHRTMLLDGDPALADVAAALDLHPRYGLADVIAGRCDLASILLDGPSGLRVVPAGANQSRLTALSAAQSRGLIAAFSDLDETPDVLVVDTAAGAGSATRQFIQAAGEVLVVVGGESPALHQNRDLIRALGGRAGHTRFRVLVNRSDDSCGAEVAERLARLTEAEVEVALHYVGAIPDDPQIERARALGLPVVNAFAHSPAGRAYKRLARRIESWAPPPRHRGGAAFFIERVIRSHQPMQCQAST
ncbi:MinD/ParA family ATP-binding protein [Spectribacter hydrogenooxidans]|uniref:AAA family ATPase n=1 Tax=Spectribacter hydrogenoxidans TaxID=3075608 RepID=A0ABU3BWC7_9GAMM|nr:AAA family ATPase [Salinisphaera sp. W335]MDT0633594.1 AAA family ATPase [Salinisphaera sp. W335]